MQLSESTLEMLAEMGDLDAMMALASIDVPCDGVKVAGGEYTPAADPWGIED